MADTKFATFTAFAAAGILAAFVAFAQTSSPQRSTAEAGQLQITLAHGTAAELETRERLLHLLNTYDLSGWLWTRKIIIEQGAIPHSHPVLTLNTRHSDNNLLLLSTLVHEEYHWFETAHPNEVAAAIDKLKMLYPGLPVGGLDGASDEESSYLHVIVCYVEWQKMKLLVGPDEARRIMDFWATDHYRAIYKLVLQHEAQVGEIVSGCGLLPWRSP